MSRWVEMGAGDEGRSAAENDLGTGVVEKSEGSTHRHDLQPGTSRGRCVFGL
jgi:hypothetical protein